jgi:hypothetical protein
MNLYGDSYDETSKGGANFGSTLTTVAALASTSDPNPFAVFVSGRASGQSLGVTRPHITVPFAGAPWGVVYNLCDSTQSAGCDANLTLVNVGMDVALLVDILRGVVTHWNDSRIQALTSAPQYLPGVPIAVVGYDANAPALAQLQQMFTDRLGAPVAFTPQISANDSLTAQSVVSWLRYSMTVTPINIYGDMSTSRVAGLVDASGTAGVIQATAQAVAACVNPADLAASAVNLATSYRLSTSTAVGCWPLVEPYFVTLPSTFADDECNTRVPQAVVWFVQHLYQFDSTPLSLQGFAPLGSAQGTALLNQVSCFGRSIAAPVVDMNYLPRGLVVFTWIVALCIGGLCMAFGAWVWRYRFHGVVNASSPVFMLQMALGCLLQILSIIPMTIEEDWISSQALLDRACMAIPWLYISGFILVYAPLLVKTWRIYKLFNNTKMIRMRITNWDLIKYEVLWSSPILAMMLFWQFSDPMVWVRSTVLTDSTTGFAVATAGTCQAHDLSPTLVPIIVMLGCGLTAGVWLTWANRNAPTEFSEGRYISANIVMLAEALILGVPVIILSSQNPLSSFIVKMLMVVLSTVLTLIIFFAPKFAIVHQWWESEKPSSERLKMGSVRIEKRGSIIGVKMPSSHLQSAPGVGSNNTAAAFGSGPHLNVFSMKSKSSWSSSDFKRDDNRPSPKNSETGGRSSPEPSPTLSPSRSFAESQLFQGSLPVNLQDSFVFVREHSPAKSGHNSSKDVSKSTGNLSGEVGHGVLLMPKSVIDP